METSDPLLSGGEPAGVSGRGNSLRAERIGPFAVVTPSDGVLGFSPN